MMSRLIGVKMPENPADARRSAEPYARHDFRLVCTRRPVSVPQVPKARSPGALTQSLLRHPFPRGRCCADWDSPPAFSTCATGRGANERCLAESALPGVEYFDLCIRMPLSAATRKGHGTGEGRSCRAYNANFQWPPQVWRSSRLPPVAIPYRSRRFWAVALARLQGLRLVAASSLGQPWGPPATSSIVRPHRQPVERNRHRDRTRSGWARMAEDHRCFSAPVVFSCRYP